jgi:5-methyltetrahydropteroyltriglutamate--homocysteine methyltransferase
MDINIPTEPVGSIPRPTSLIAAWRGLADGSIGPDDYAHLVDEAVIDTLRRFEATGSPVITDGEQRKAHNFVSYCVDGQDNIAPDGFCILFEHHSRRLPRLTAGPLRLRQRAADHLELARAQTRVPLKQALVAPSALSLLYTDDALEGYPREDFIDDLLSQLVGDMRACLALGAVTVQLDFTDGRLACKLDPSGALLHDFISLNNLALSQLPAAARHRVGIHTCPGGDRDSTHSADVDYAELLPSLFELNAGRFFVALAREPDRRRVLAQIVQHRKPQQQVFVGVIDPLDPRIETAEEVRDRLLEAAEFIPPAQLGSTDDCGFAPFCDDRSTSRETAFAKIEARVRGTRLAARALSRVHVGCA